MNPADADGADEVREAIPLGGYGTAADVAEAVVFLAGPAGRQMTGATLTIDGGSNT